MIEYPVIGYTGRKLGVMQFPGGNLWLEWCVDPDLIGGAFPVRMKVKTGWAMNGGGWVRAVFLRRGQGIKFLPRFTRADD